MAASYYENLSKYKSYNLYILTISREIKVFYHSFFWYCCETENLTLVYKTSIMFFNDFKIKYFNYLSHLVC